LKFLSFMIDRIFNEKKISSIRMEKVKTILLVSIFPGKKLE
jgi:hypothetical protein